MKSNKRETVGIGDIYDIVDALNDLQGQINDNRKLIRTKSFVFAASIWGLCAAGLYLTHRIDKLEAKIEEMQENEME